LQDHIAMDMDGYLLYCCQDDGCSLEKKRSLFYNSHVVPYNPNLT
jgi:hypothetical protein